MKKYNIKFKDLEDALCDGKSIDSILSDKFDLLYVSEFGRSFDRFQDSELNQEYNDYFKAKCHEEKITTWKN